MRCRHCYHKFWVHRIATIGKLIDAPVKLYVPPPSDQESVAAKYVSQTNQERNSPSVPLRRAA